MFIPGSYVSNTGACWDKGPGVLPAPGDLASSFIAPPYDNDELGGRCKVQIIINFMEFLSKFYIEKNQTIHKNYTCVLL